MSPSAKAILDRNPTAAAAFDKWLMSDPEFAALFDGCLYDTAIVAAFIAGFVSGVEAEMSQPMCLAPEFFERKG